MSNIQYFRAPIIGLGTDDDSCRPSCVDALPPGTRWQIFDERPDASVVTGTMLVAIAIDPPMSVPDGCTAIDAETWNMAIGSGS